MKKRYHLFLIFIMALVIINSGCDTKPVTLATSADGVEINFSNQGKGEPVIFLVHGWTNNNTIWDLQIPALSEKYQVIALDLAGHGKSGNEREKWTMSAFGEDIACVVNAAKVKNVVLVGFSMGGPAILEAAKILPDQVSGLILIDALKNPEYQYPPPVTHLIDSTFMDLIDNPTVEKAMRLGFFVNNPEESVEKVKSMIDRDRTGWRESLSENFRWSNEDCIGSLEALNVPLLAINTDAMPTEVNTFKKYVPSFEAIILSGTGHVMMWDVTDEFNSALEKSIQEIISLE